MARIFISPTELTNIAMKILLTNDDGIHAGGLEALERRLKPQHELFTCAPGTEQSGVSQAITFLRPLFAVPVGGHANPVRYAVDGTPSDAVKLAMFELCPFVPDLVISGINGGLNAGVNVSYSGTVGGALEASMYGIPTFALSLEYSGIGRYSDAADRLIPIVESIYEDLVQMGDSVSRKIVYNINLPAAAMDHDEDPVWVPTESNRHGHHFEKGVDPKQRSFFWATNNPDPEPSPFDTDVQVLARGLISITPLTFNMTDESTLAIYQSIKQQK
jgi:5'-nucleotidase